MMAIPIEPPSTEPMGQRAEIEEDELVVYMAEPLLTPSTSGGLSARRPSRNNSPRGDKSKQTWEKQQQ